MEDYEQRFGGVSRLFGRAGLERLRAAHVAVIGVGGVGSWTVEALARSGLGALTLVDLDDVCVSNVNRQLPALDGTIGRPKVDVLAERVRAINPECRVNAVPEFFTGQSAGRLLATDFDYVVDAIDAMAQKALLLAACRARGFRALTVGAAGGKRDATLIRAGDLGEASGDELLRQVRRKLRRDHAFPAGRQKGKMRWGIRSVWSNELPLLLLADDACVGEPTGKRPRALGCDTGFGTGVFVTGTFGLVAAGEVVRDLAAGGAGRHPRSL